MTYEHRRTALYLSRYIVAKYLFDVSLKLLEPHRERVEEVTEGNSRPHLYTCMTSTQRDYVILHLIE